MINLTRLKLRAFVQLKSNIRASLVVQWLGNLPANAGDMGSSPGLGRSHMLQSN